MRKYIGVRFPEAVLSLGRHLGIFALVRSWHLGKLRVYDIRSVQMNRFLRNLIQSKRGRIYTASQKLQTKYIEIITPNIPALKKKKSQNGKSLSRSQKIYGF